VAPFLNILKFYYKQIDLGKGDNYKVIF
jgi:hypothetical protein